MGRIVSKISRVFHINGRDLPVFLLSLLLAFSIWFLYNLSLRYTDYLQVSVVACSSIEGHAAESSNRGEVIARCRTTGYDIIRIKSSKRKPVYVNFSRMKSAGGELFYVTASDLQEYTHLIFGSDVSLEYYLTDTLFFRFPYETYKQVPVRPVHNIGFRSQYTLVGEVHVQPDSVLIYGEPYRLDKIDYVYTNPVKLSNVDSDIHGLARLEPIRGVRFSEDAVRYSAEVVRYVEISRQVQIEYRNVPEDKSMMVYPSVAEVRFRCTFPYKGNAAEGVGLYVDYADFANSRGGRCVARTDALPEGVVGYTVHPEVFECVVSDR